MYILPKKEPQKLKSEVMHRKEQNKMCTSRKRASESFATKQKRRKNKKTAIANKRAVSIPTEKVISTFHSKSKLGPQFVCMCCHRLMYKQNVVVYNKSKYLKASSNLLERVFTAKHSYVSPDGKQWVCKTCDKALGRGNMPLQAKANGLQLCSVPPELADLNALELRLISLRVPFMKMVTLPSGNPYMALQLMFHLRLIQFVMCFHVCLLKLSCYHSSLSVNWHIEVIICMII